MQWISHRDQERDLRAGLQLRRRLKADVEVAWTYLLATAQETQDAEEQQEPFHALILPVWLPVRTGVEPDRYNRLQMSDVFQLNGKTAMITGGGSGIGEATSKLFGEAGATVLVVDIDEARAQACASAIKGAQALACDITDESQVKTLFGKVESLDILVNCAGIGAVGTVEETDLEEFHRLFRVNVDGTFLMTRAALPLLKKSHGSVLNIGSVAGLVGVKRRFGYCATKGAVIAMTRQLAVDYPDRNPGQLHRSGNGR